MKRSILALLLCVLSGIAFAASSGPYVGLNVGQSSTDKLQLSDKTATGFSVTAGYQFNPYFGVDVQYIDFGSVTFTTGGKSDIIGYSLSVVGSYPFDSKWSGFIRLGATHTRIKSVANYGVAARCNGSWGIGGQYNVSPSWGVRLSYDSYGVGAEGPLERATTSLTSVGVVYKF